MRETGHAYFRNYRQCHSGLDKRLGKGGISISLPSRRCCLPRAVPALAQVDLGSIKGRIQDSSSAVIASASVTATNVATHTVRSTVSNRDGEYALPSLAPGTYELQASAPGFGSVTAQISIVGGKSETQDFLFRIGQHGSPECRVGTRHPGDRARKP